MRRIDAIGIVFGVFVLGGLAYVVLQIAGLNDLSAGIWSQVLLVTGLIGWLFSYIFRAVGNKMTYHQQREEYEKAFLQNQLDRLSPEQKDKLLAEIEQKEGT
ncbi:Protein of unknown function (DUF3007) [Rivularia sp. PCC 7116]|uniref:DUF3007 family protein n=1 Tax=Rivularia sp. PCC 7116 TaxID=373994 RepID=UPI00029EE10A|nr:DUF3007 family protein [Rivularia sp. PCC 7116]AFY57081.1 Protein of unknown function (DUF3007) [Rivularia sp. PCC 7116]